MAKLTKYGREFGKYVKANVDLINENTMLTHHLSESILSVINGQEPLRNYFNVDDGDLHIACLHIDNEFLIYGNGFNAEMIALVDKEIDFSKLKKFTFSGTKEILEALFRPYDFKTEVIKHRIIYKSNSVLDISYSSGRLEMAEIHHLETLVPYCLEFSREYYSFSDKGSKEMRAGTLKSILDRRMYLWTDNNQIVSMVQVIEEDEHDFPFIGFYYTPPQFRGKGYGTSMLHQVTKGTLDAGYEYIMLTADGSNPVSNRSFQKIGYKNVGEYLKIWKEKIV